MKFWMKRNMVRENFCILMDHTTKVNSTMTNLPEKEQSSMLMAPSTKEISIMIRSKV